MRFVGGAAVMLALVLNVMAARPASAGFSWCDGEPNAKVEVAGRRLTVQLWIGVSEENRSDLGGLSSNQQQFVVSVVNAQPVAGGTLATIRAVATVQSATGQVFPVRLRLAVPALDAKSEYIYGASGTPLSNQLQVLVPDQGGHEGDEHADGSHRDGHDEGGRH